MNDIETTENQALANVHRLQRGRMAFFGLVILAAGIAIGAASMLILVPEKLLRPPGGPEFGSMRMIPPLRRELGLSPEQEQKIKPILDRHMQTLDDIRMEARSSIEQALIRMNESISDILTDEQRQIWQQSLERLEREFYPGGSRRGGGPRGPGGFRRGRQERFRDGPPEHFRGGPGPFGPRRGPMGPNSPRDGMDSGATDN